MPGVACQKRIIEMVIINQPTMIGPSTGSVVLPRPLQAKYEWQELSAEIHNSYRFDGKSALLTLDNGMVVKPFFEARDPAGRMYLFPLTGLLGGKELIFETGNVPVGTSIVSLAFHTAGASITIKRLLWRSYVRQDVKR